MNNQNHENLFIKINEIESLNEIEELNLETLEKITGGQILELSDGCDGCPCNLPDGCPCIFVAVSRPHPCPDLVFA